MSARASRLRLEEELRNISEQEERLDGEVNQLLQAKAAATGPGAPEELPPAVALSNGHHPPKAGAAAAAAAPTEVGGGADAKTPQDVDNGTVVVVAAGGAAADGEGGLAQCLEELSGSVPDFPGLQEKAGALLAQIEDGHGMAERVSRSVRRLDDIQMRVQRALALVEDVINLRGCAEGVRAAVQAGDLAEAATYVRRFREIDAGALADSGEMVDMDEAVRGLSSAVLERFETAVLDMDEPGIAAACPLLAPLGLATRGQELYLGFARRALEAELEAGSGDGSLPATQGLPAIYNTSAAFLRRQVPVAAAGLAPCLGDVALVRVVTRECGDRAATVLEKHLREQSVASWAADGVEGWGVAGAAGGGGAAGGTEGGGGGGGGSAAAAAAAEVLGKADALLEELAVLTQHTESYDRFVKFLVMEVESAHPSQEEFDATRAPTNGEDGESKTAGGGGGAAAAERPSVLPAPILEPVMPARTRLQEAGAEVAVYYSQIEGQLLEASVSKAIAVDEVAPGAAASSCAEDAFFVAQRCAKRALATGHAGAASAVVNHVGNTLGVDLLEALVRKVKSTLSTLPAGGGGTLDLTIKQLGQIDFTDLASLKDQLQMDNWEGMGAGLASDLTSSATAAISNIRRTGAGAVPGVSGGISAGGGGLGSTPGGAGMSGAGGGRPDASSAMMGGGVSGGAGGAGGGIGGNMNSNECLVYVNTLEACSTFAVRLREMLERDASAAFGGGAGGGGGGAGHDAERVMSCLQGLGSTRALFTRAASDCLEEVLNRLRQVLRTVVSSHLGEKSAVSYQLSENQYAANEAEDPYAHALVEYLRLLLEPYRPPGGLSDSLFLELLTLVAGYLAKRMEIALKKRLFTQLGGLQLDKDLRCVMGFFTQQAGRGAREPFSRLAQMSLLLNLERPQDAMDYWEPGSPLQAQLTADEVVSVLQQREDFAREDLASLVLPESYKG
ncbi:conserved unknown protein [Ectocarpus siliculosus]|uniref:Conserved oligomeric Golgi complex subunit 4 n=1 Tax=Ectocarpus siliculosus TaxID=2880 RepID=D7FT87_ECTSI|nr:conserved unknown protein [Ectocarpus siliculosus]|eukprot:CBJ31353.1 conserved unknown protein [Ectocarpus siliculosus]